MTNNENGICENVTYERNKRVIQGYTTPKGEQVAGLTGNTLRYYKTDFVPREPNNRNKRALVAAATDLLCIKNDVYREQPSFGGRRLKPAAARYFDDGRTQMLIIYNELAVHQGVRILEQPLCLRRQLRACGRQSRGMRPARRHLRCLPEGIETTQAQRKCPCSRYAFCGRNNNRSRTRNVSFYLWKKEVKHD